MFSVIRMAALLMILLAAYWTWRAIVVVRIVTFWNDRIRDSARAVMATTADD